MTQKLRSALDDDTRVDCICYILSPERLLAPDVELMQALSGVTYVIPLIGKADTMDPEDREKWQKKVHAYLSGKEPDKNGNKCDPPIISAEQDFYYKNDRVYSIMGSDRGQSRRYGRNEDGSPVFTVELDDSGFSDTAEFVKNFTEQLEVIKKKKKHFLKDFVPDNWIQGPIQISKQPIQNAISTGKYILLIAIILGMIAVMIKEMTIIYMVYPSLTLGIAFFITIFCLLLWSVFTQWDYNTLVGKYTGKKKQTEKI